MKDKYNGDRWHLKAYKGQKRALMHTHCKMSRERKAD